MPSTVHELREHIRGEGRAAGLSVDGAVSEAEIRRRRRQIAGVGLGVFFVLVLATLRADVWDDVGESWVDPALLKAATITLTGGFIAYVVDKELHLRRLTRLGHRTREVHVRTAERLLEHAALARLDGPLTESLVLEDVLDAVLEGTIDVTGAASAAVHLLDRNGVLTVWATRGADPGTGSGSRMPVAERVAQGRRPLLVSSGGVPVVADGVAMAAPLRVRDRLVGVVEMRAAPAWPFDALDLELLDRCCRRAANAVANACLFEEALLEADRPSPIDPFGPPASPD